MLYVSARQYGWRRAVEGYSTDVLLTLQPRLLVLSLPPAAGGVTCAPPDQAAGFCFFANRE